MKTIHELNSRWWYRLMKVIFIGATLVCVLITIIIVVSINSPRQVSDYKVNCTAEYTNQKTLFAEKDAGIYIYQYGSSNIYQSLSDDAKLKLREVCGISKNEADASNAAAIAYIKDQQNLGISQDEIQKYIDDNLRPYKISSTYITEGSYVSVVFYSALSILGLLVVFEIIRRAFYYIFLGTIRPKII